MERVVLEGDDFGLVNGLVDDVVGLFNEFDIVDFLYFWLNEEFVLLVVHYFIYYNYSHQISFTQNDHIPYGNLSQIHCHAFVCCIFL